MTKTVSYYDEILNRYISDNNTNYALLINGTWGSGKTYYIKNYLNSRINNNEYIKIYFSLYGMQKLEDIDSCIIESYFKAFDEMVEFNNLNIEKYYRDYGFGNFVINKFQYIYDQFFYHNIKSRKYYKFLKYLPDYIKFEFLNFDFKVLKDNLKFKISQISKESKVLLVIDDFERSKIDFVEVLGYINNMVEHYKYKVIIIANEEQLKVRYANKDINLKLSALLVNYDIDKEVDKNIDKVTSIYNFINDNLHHDIEYYSIKEKTIGETVNFKLKFNEIFNEILNVFLNSLEQNEKSKRFKRNISKYISSITKEFEELGNKNLRNVYFTIKYLFILFERYYNCANKKNKNWDSQINYHKKKEFCKYRKEIIKKILRKIIRMIIKLKEHPKETKNKELMFIIGDNYDQLIDNLIFNHNIDKYEINEIFINGFFRYYNNNKLTIYDIDNEEKIFKLDSDKNIIDKINKIERELASDEYEINQFTYIIRVLLDIKYKYNIRKNYNLKNIFNIILDKAKKSKDKVDYYIERNPYTKDYCPEEYEVLDKIYCELNMYRNINVNIKDELNNIFKKHKLDVYELSTFIEKNMESNNYFVLLRGFVKFVNQDIFKITMKNFLENGKLNYINKLRECFAKVYNFDNLNDFFLDDLKNLNNLEKIIVQQINYSDDELRKYLLELLGKDIKQIISKIKS